MPFKALDEFLNWQGYNGLRHEVELGNHFLQRDRLDHVGLPSRLPVGDRRWDDRKVLVVLAHESNAGRMRVVPPRLMRRAGSRVRRYRRRKLNASLTGRQLVPICLDRRKVATAGGTTPNFARLHLDDRICSGLGWTFQTVKRPI